MSNLVDELLTWSESQQSCVCGGRGSGRLGEDTCKVLLGQGKSCPDPQVSSLLVEDSTGPEGKK